MTRVEEIGRLIERIAHARDRSAFIELFNFAAPRIKAFGLRAGTAPEIADELAQETLIAVWRKAALYDSGKAPGMAWIYAIARNKRIDLFRREVRPELDPNEPALAPPENENAEEKVIWGSSIAALHQHLGELPPDQASVIRMAFIEDKAHSAIATELGLPLGTVKSRIRLGLDRLRNSLMGASL